VLTLTIATSTASMILAVKNTSSRMVGSGTTIITISATISSGIAAPAMPPRL
jgi:hypothetical protein